MMRVFPRHERYNPAPGIRDWILVVLITLSTAGLLAPAARGAIQRGCVQDDRIAAGLAPFPGNICTANDLTFVLIGLGIQQDGCVTPSDSSVILDLRAIVENTGAGTRYDAGLWISVQGDVTRCTLTGEVCATAADCSGGQNFCTANARWGACAREITREPAFVQGSITCTPSTGGVDLTCGDGPFINDDGDGCGDVRKFGTGGPPDCGRTVDLRVDPTNALCNSPDGAQDQTVFDFDTPVTLPCVDRDQNGFVEIPTCTSWSQNATEITCPSKTCSVSGSQCVSDADCPGGQTCNDPSCSICSGSGASCASDAGCPSGQSCAGTCSGTGAFCNDSIACAGGQTCQTRTCQGSGDPCASDANCPVGQVCSGASDPTCRTELAVPGTSSKCNCLDGLNSNVPVAELGLECSCQQPTTVQPGAPVVCTLSYDNPQPANCTPDLADPERFRCGGTGYLRFDLDDGLIGAESGTFSGICSDLPGPWGFCSITTSTPCELTSQCPAGETCLAPLCNVDGDCPGGTCSLTSAAGAAVATPDQLQWIPASNASSALGIVAAGDSDALDFIYSVSSGAPEGPITLTASTLWTNRTCSASGTICETDSHCPAGETCDLDFAAAVAQPLSITCPLDIRATYAAVSSFSAHERGGRVAVEWETAAEAGTLGYHLYRLDPDSGDYLRVNDELLPSVQQVPGGTYTLVDEGASLHDTVTYRLVEVDARGGEHVYGPFEIQVDWQRPRHDRLTDSDFKAESHKPSPRMAARLQQLHSGAILDRASAAKTGSQGAGNSAVKILVEQTGPYVVGASQIAAGLGEPVGKIQAHIRNGGLRMSHRGNEVSWLPQDGGQALVFFGESVDSLFTRQNVYWLEVGRGRPMQILEGSEPQPQSDPLTFQDSLHIEEDRLLGTSVATDPAEDYWFWTSVLSGNSKWGRATADIELHGVAPTLETARLTVHLFGFTSTAVDPDHSAEVRVNQVPIGQLSWDQTGHYSEALAFDQDLLQEGVNTVELVGTAGRFFLDSYDLSYHRLYTAVGDRLLLRGDTNPVITVSGFSQPDISVYAVNDSLQPVRLDATTVDQGNGGFRVSFRPASAEEQYLAVSSAGLLAPEALQGDSASTLRSRRNRADYLAITSAELEAAAEPLAEHRRSRGLEVMVVVLADILDEFNHGIYDPNAIREFLSYAHREWELAPSFVTLAGKGSLDYRDILGLGANPVPPLMAATSQGLATADNLFVDFDGDMQPEMAIGRLPVLTPEELEAATVKIIAYEAAADEPWASRVVLAADNPDSAGNFPQDSDGLASLVPAGYTVEKIYLYQPHSRDEARQRMFEVIGDGAFLLNYLGHGGLDRFASEGMLLTGDVPALENGSRLPVTASLTCNIGLFSIPGFSSLGEELVLQPQGGAAAVWGPTWLSFNQEAVRLGQSFFAALFDSDELTLGDAITRAIRSYIAGGGDPELAAVYNLLGDPALMLKNGPD